MSRKADEKQQNLEEWRQAMQAEYERLDALPLAGLAAEVMIKGFGPGGPGAYDDAISLGQAHIGAGPSAHRISVEFAPDAPYFLGPGLDDMKLRGRSSSGYLDWATTRRGRAALEGGDVLTVLRAAARWAARPAN